MNEMLSLPPGTPPSRTLWYYLLILVLAALIVGGIWYALSMPRAMKVAPELQPPLAETEATPFDDLLTVADQKAGSSVIVDMVDIGAPGVWVVVAEIRDGAVWRAYGAARAKGPAKDIRVDLLKPTVPGTEYAVVLYRDDGDEVYELHGDSAYVDFGTGEKVQAYFKAN